MARTHQPDEAVFRSVLPEEIDWRPFPAFPPEVVAVLPKPSHYPRGSPANSDINANYATGFRAQEKAGAALLAKISSRVARQEIPPSN